MTRLQTARRRPRRQTRPKPPAQAPAAVAGGGADPRIRPLLERYCALAGVKQTALGPDHCELRLPPAERPFFRDRESLRVAFSLDPLERDPDAEIAVLGSPFLSQLIEAIRARAARLSLGLIAPAAPAASDTTVVELTLPVRDGTAEPGATRLAVHPVGRLVARVVLRAGAGVEEAVVESDVFDLSAFWTINDTLSLRAGIDNVFDTDPAITGRTSGRPLGTSLNIGGATDVIQQYRKLIAAGPGQQ